MGPNCRQARRPAKSASPSDLFQASGQPSTPAREGAEENMKIKILRIAFLFIAVFAVSFSSLAQDNSNSSDAHLFGSLLDSSGAVIGGVSVTAQVEGDTTARVWKTISSSDGAYKLTIPPGRYRVSFERSPFVSHQLVLNLAPNQQRTLDVSLSLERLSASA